MNKYYCNDGSFTSYGRAWISKIRRLATRLPIDYSINCTIIASTRPSTVNRLWIQNGAHNQAVTLALVWSVPGTTCALRSMLMQETIERINGLAAELRLHEGRVALLLLVA